MDPFRDLDAPAIVFLFTRSDCPISNRYAPEVSRLHGQFSPHGVAFWLVYPDPAESGDSIADHLSEYGYGFGALRDPQHALVAMANVRVTPEAAVFVPAKPEFQMVYRGRIDDRFVAFGQRRPAPAVRDLEQVLEAVVRGQPVSPRTTEAIGCFIADLK
ncbi:MAG TPA: redoxin domain-containing protein [Pirellulaceae bacterium]|nr:redoxin domain-containing protein [Pirellulaceae bacterium]